MTEIKHLAKGRDVIYGAIKAIKGALKLDVMNECVLIENHLKIII